MVDKIADLKRQILSRDLKIRILESHPVFVDYKRVMGVIGDGKVLESILLGERSVLNRMIDELKKLEGLQGEFEDQEIADSGEEVVEAPRVESRVAQSKPIMSNVSGFKPNFRLAKKIVPGASVEVKKDSGRDFDYKAEDVGLTDDVEEEIPGLPDFDELEREENGRR